ncbi:M28 family peptidase [Haladaptatus pallidirubidus]|uniref:Carboxypeptidase Q n=1 Tax=Haladaptatus pallidirubidus TaxID=1008152 RepID=A0AAV3UPH2_9EURY|nr:M28 family peptidase [Haladaptatus pallidirubidus]
MADWIRKTFRSDTGWNHLETLVDIENRMAGSDGEREGAERTCENLAEVGARNAHLEAFDLQGWLRGTSSLIHQGSGESFDCITLPRSPSEAVIAEFVDLGYGVEEDFADANIKGKVVMVASNAPPYYDRFPHRTEKYYHAVENGAVGFIFQNHVEGCLPPTGSVGRPSTPIGDIPALGVSKEVGTQLARVAQGEDIELLVNAEIYDGTSQNVHAEIGPETDMAVLITSHVDAHDISEGAADNGAGTAMLVEIANALAERESDLETRVEFIAFGAEEGGLCGSEYHDSVTDTEDIKVIVNCDGVVGGRTLQFFTHTFDELESAVERVAGRFDHPVRIIHGEGWRGDQWPLVRWGVPGYFVSGYRDTEGRGWGHTYADTLDKLESRNLREQAILLTELAVDLARSDVDIEHRTPEEVAASFEQEGRAEGIKHVGEWPYEFEYSPFT